MTVLVKQMAHLEWSLAIAKGMQKAMLSNVGFNENRLDGVEGERQGWRDTNKGRTETQTKEAAQEAAVGLQLPQWCVYLVVPPVVQ